MVNQILLQHYTAGKFAVPIALPNHTFKPQGLPMWAKWQLMPTNKYKGNLQATEQAGILQITLFVPTGTKTGIIEQKADDITEWFGTEKQHLISGKNVMIMESIAHDAMPDDGGWYMMPISIKYRVI